MLKRIKNVNACIWNYTVSTSFFENKFSSRDSISDATKYFCSFLKSIEFIGDYLMCNKMEEFILNKLIYVSREYIIYR